ncbi:hypothetical protein [Paludibacterium paludis]|uniref:Uncharacterized protein n=1 Tax=Paludibacterium paludis TaxID=1225769 RepID=A0A918P5Z0_9NEIS|nr:hypothetical protein [Paludibacterium paludis]GGY23864.1 hypothetical protein GCM10011289_29450 [Paludibacterium paludis]
MTTIRSMQAIAPSPLANEDAVSLAERVRTAAAKTGSTQDTDGSSHDNVSEVIKLEQKIAFQDFYTQLMMPDPDDPASPPQLDTQLM